MGYMHFKQMYEDALLLDCQALPVALDLGALTAATSPPLLGVAALPDPWEGCGFDEAMRDARKLVVMYRDNFAAELKEMVARRDVRPRIPVLPSVPVGASLVQQLAVAFAAQLHPPMQYVSDPKVIDYDEPCLEPAEFYRLMLRF